MYGSLMRGYWNYARVLAPFSPRVVRASAAGTLYHLSNKGWPALVGGDWEPRVVWGELQCVERECAAAVLRALDELEGYNAQRERESQYVRRELRVTTYESSPRVVKAWGYIYNEAALVNRKDERVIVTDGDWRRYHPETFLKVPHSDTRLPR